MAPTHSRDIGATAGAAPAVEGSPSLPVPPTSRFLWKARPISYGPAHFLYAMRPHDNRIPDQVRGVRRRTADRGHQASQADCLTTEHGSPSSRRQARHTLPGEPEVTQQATGGYAGPPELHRRSAHLKLTACNGFSQVANGETSFRRVPERLIGRGCTGCAVRPVADSDSRPVRVRRRPRPPAR